MNLNFILETKFQVYFDHRLKSQKVIFQVLGRNSNRRIQAQNVWVLLKISELKKCELKWEINIQNVSWVFHKGNIILENQIVKIFFWFLKVVHLPKILNIITIIWQK